MFYLPLRPQASVKANTLDLSLVIPADHFDPHNPVSTADVLTEDVPSPVRRTFGQFVPVTPQRIMRIQLRLRSPGFVLMPAIKPMSPVIGTPHDLLLCLQSLSQTLSIDAFTVMNIETEAALLNLGTRLRQGKTKTSPLYFRSMFGDKGAKRNNWTAFGFDSGASEFEASSGSLADDPPPDYAEALRKVRIEGSAINSACGSASPDPESVQLEMIDTNLEPTQPDTPSDVVARQSPAPHHTNPDLDDNQSVGTFITETSLEQTARESASPTLLQRKRQRPHSSSDDNVTYTATGVGKKRAVFLSRQELHPTPNQKA